MIPSLNGIFWDIALERAQNLKASALHAHKTRTRAKNKGPFLAEIMVLHVPPSTLNKRTVALTPKERNKKRANPFRRVNLGFVPFLVF